jgi:hypothetical protein
VIAPGWSVAPGDASAVCGDCGEGQEARETASLASDASEAASARPGARQASKTLRQRVEAACDAAEARKWDYVNGEIAVETVLAAVRAALQPFGRNGGYQAKARAAAIARGVCSRCLTRVAAEGKRTCATCLREVRAAKIARAKAAG